MMDQRIRIADQDGVRRIVLDRTEKMNALDAAMMRAIARAARDVPPGIDVLVIAGRGAKGFCAGADIAELAQGEEQLTVQEHALLDMIAALAESPLPILVLAHGRTLGAGGMLTSLADVTLAADDLQFGFPEIRFHMYPAIVHGVLMQKTSAPFAAQLCASGRLLSATEALAAGLVSEVLPAARFEAEAEARVAFYCERRIALSIAKRALRATLPIEALRQRLAVLAPMLSENYRRAGVREAMAGGPRKTT